VGENVAVKKSGYGSLFRETEYMKFIIAKLISRFGDSIDVVAYGWMVFRLTGSAVMLATLYAVNGIPSFLFNMISGVVVSYWPKKRVVFICDYGRGLTVLLTGLLFMNGMLEVWHLFVFTFINSTFEAFRGPAAMPLFTQVISKDKYDHAVSLDSSGTTLVELVGYSIAGLMIGLMGVGGVIVLDAATFLICGLIISTIKVKKETIVKDQLTIKQYFKDLKEGFDYIISKKVVMSICLFAGVFNLFLIPFNALQPAYVKTVLNRGPSAISIMAVSFLVSMIIGSILAPAVKSKLSGYKMFILSGFVIALCYAGLSQMDKFSETALLYLPLVLLCALMGFVIPLMNMPIKVGLMSKVEPEYLPRTVSLVNALALSSTPLGGGLVGLLIGFLALQKVYLIFSIALIGLFIVQMFNKGIKEL